jgi:hypothetical protein
VKLSSDEIRAMWPRTLDRQCTWCGERGEATWTGQGDLLCDWDLAIYRDRP